MNVCLEKISPCGCTPAKYNMVFNCCCREEAQRVRNTVPTCMTDCNNDIIINVIVKCGCVVISPYGCESDGPINFSNLIPVKRCECCECCGPEHFCVIMTSSNPCTSQALCNCPEMFICDEDKTIKITFVFNQRGSCRCCSPCKNRCSNDGGGFGGGCGLEWLLLLFLC